MSSGQARRVAFTHRPEETLLRGRAVCATPLRQPHVAQESAYRLSLDPRLPLVQWVGEGEQAEREEEDMRRTVRYATGREATEPLAEKLDATVAAAAHAVELYVALHASGGRVVRHPGGCLYSATKPRGGCDGS